MSYKIITITIAVFFFGIFSGFLVSKYYAERLCEGSFQEGWNAARNRLISIGGFQGVHDDLEIKSISGNVISVSDNKITVKTIPLDILSDPVLEERTVVIDSSTKIYKIFKKSDQEYQEEVNRMKETGDYSQLADSADGSVSMFYNKEVNKSELKIGDQLLIEAENDIKNLKELSAVKITISNSSSISK